ncbi:MAG: trigger factor [Oscillospiraceae bacterium]|nr:trigger factor [Oscillospiraceae bacterium]
MSLKNSTKTKENTYEVEVSVDAETFAKACNKAYKKQVKNINVPGFRKGKAPKSIIEKMYGEGVFYEDAMQDCYPEALDSAAKEADLNVIAVDSLEALDASKDGFTFKATVITYPVIDINDYKGIPVTKKSTRVTKKLIDEEIEKVRDRNSRMVTVEDGEVVDGDMVVIDFEGMKDGVAFEGGKAENYNLKIGSGNFIPGFEEQIIGHKTGEEFTISVKFPEDYQAEELKGADAEFKINLHEIKRKELPELDDEFVKDVSDKETLDEYKEEIKETVKKRLEDEQKKDIEDQVITKLCDSVEGEIPEQMYDNAVNEMIQEFDMRLRSQGMDFDTYMKYMGATPDTLKEMYRPDAERRVKLRLALEKIAEKENFEITADELDAEYNRLAEQYKMDVEDVKKAINGESLSADLKTQKAMDFAVDNSKTESKKSTEEKSEE